MTLKNKIISITGGTGFIGTKLINKLKSNNNQIRILSRKDRNSSRQIQFFKGDLTNINDEKIIENFLKDADIVFHCASELSNENKMHDLHYFGTKRLIKYSNISKLKWIQLSSVGVYGKYRSGKIDHSSFENPNDIYEQTKLLSDQLVINSGLKFSILRPSIVIGTSMKNQSFYELAKIIKKKLFFYIDKKAIMNFVHVDDVINALLLCGSIKKAVGKTFIISNKITIRDLVESLSDGMNVKYPKISIPENLLRFITPLFKRFSYFPLSNNRIDALTNKSFYDSSLIKEELNFSFNYNLKEVFKEYGNTIK